MFRKVKQKGQSLPLCHAIHPVTFVLRDNKYMPKLP